MRGEFNFDILLTIISKGLSETHDLISSSIESTYRDVSPYYQAFAHGRPPYSK